NRADHQKRACGGGRLGRALGDPDVALAVLCRDVGRLSCRIPELAAQPVDYEIDVAVGGVGAGPGHGIEQVVPGQDGSPVPREFSQQKTLSAGELDGRALVVGAEQEVGLEGHLSVSEELPHSAPANNCATIELYAFMIAPKDSAVDRRSPH